MSVDSTTSVPLPLAAERYQVTPCIVIGAGEDMAARFEQMRAAIEPWLGASFPSSGVIWGCIQSADQGSAEWANQLLKPVLSLDLWLYLRDHKYVDAIPSGQALTPLRIYILYDMAGKACDTALLTTINQTLRQAATQRAQLEQTLLLLSSTGSSHTALPTLGFDNVCVIEPVGRGGLGIEPELRNHIARILLHALVASEAGAMLSTWTRSHNGTARPLLGIGASAITTAIAHMREYQAALVTQALLQPYVGTITDQEQIIIAKQGAEAATNIGDWQATTEGVFLNHGWSKGDPAAGGIVPVASSPLWSGIQSCSSDFVQHLTAHLIELDRSFREECAIITQAERKQWLEQIHVIAVPGNLSDEAQAQRLALLLSMLEANQVVGNAQLTWAICWLDGVIDTLQRQLARRASRSMVYGSDETSWQKYAEVAFITAYHQQLRFLRLQAATGTLAQIIWRSLPAWPILALLSQIFLTLPAWIIWLGTFVVYITLTLLVAMRTRTNLHALERQLQQQRLVQVRELVYGIAAYHSRVADENLLQSLATTRRELSILQSALTHRQEWAVEKVKEIEGESRTRERLLIEYFLYDLPRCMKWAHDVIEHEIFGWNVTSSGLTDEAPPEALHHIVARLIRHTADQQIFGVAAAQLIEQMTVALSEQGLIAPQLSAIELCDRDLVVKEGQRWTWLYTRAHPMAGAGLSSEELTIIVLSDYSDLSGAYGRSNPQWGKDWREARSRQPHRITCIRVLTLP